MAFYSSGSAGIINIAYYTTASLNRNKGFWFFKPLPKITPSTTYEPIEKPPPEAGVFHLLRPCAYKPGSVPPTTFVQQFSILSQ
jgi:hypothetical protein